MKKHSRLLLLVVLTMVLAGIGDLSADPTGLICGVPEDPIPCSTFTGNGCVYVTYDPESNCCIPTVPSPRCPWVCC